MSLYAVDFESEYSKEVSITVQGMHGYLHHPEVEIYLVAIVGPDGEEFCGHPRDFDWDCLIGHEIVSQNALFDRSCYLRLQELDPSLPNLSTPLWWCTANMSVYMRGGRSLKKAAKNLLGWDIVKDVRDKMKGIRAGDMIHMPSDDPDYPNFYEQVRGYAIHDARAARELALQYGPSWPEMERRLSDLTIRGCLNGIPVDVEKLEHGKCLLSTRLWEVDQSLPWVADGYAPTSPKGLAETCRKAGIPHPPSTAEDDHRTILWEETYGDQYSFVKDMRTRRKANILLKRVTTLLDEQCNGRFHYSLKYHGAAGTARWSGGYGG